MILKGDCIEVMKGMKPNSVDAIVCDPPYGLEFMGKEWDKLGWDTRNVYDSTTGLGRYLNKNRPRYQAGLQAQLWHTQWLIEAYRVLKPGGSMLVMGGTRTFHRLACAIEDSGFIIKDTLMWIYGSGFPKAQDLGKMIDKRANAKRKITGHKGGRYNSPGTDIRKGSYIGGEPGKMMNLGNITEPVTDLAKHWDGFKVGGIKPAYEPIIWAVKPPEGSYVGNVLKHGVGAVNVDECRIPAPEGLTKGGCTKWGGIFGSGDKCSNPNGNPKGRFPANIILDEEAGKMLDEQSGRLSQVGGAKKTTHKDGMFGIGQPGQVYFDGNSGASRFFYCAKASRGERNAGLEDMPLGEPPASARSKAAEGRKNPLGEPRANHHPTVKPIKLFEWLIKLVTREDQIVLDPFIGSGTTAIAAHNTGRKCVGIEKEDEYIEIAKRRIEHRQIQPHQLALGE